MYKAKVQFYNRYGEGVVLLENKPFYIFGTILGEEIEFKIISENKNYGYGELIKVIKPSKNRVDHNIKDAHLIGGYELIHMNDDEQRNFKINQVISDFKKNSSVDIENKISWFSGKKRFKYRNKITLHDGYFYQKHTNEKIDVDDFLLSEIKWDKSKKGEIIYRQLDTLIFGSPTEKLFTTDTLLNYKFRISLNSFYQVNKEVAEYAYNFIRSNIIPNLNTLDLYCGIGTISIIVSNVSKKVVGVEISKNSYEDALFNKQYNKADNVEFVNFDVFDYVNQNKNIKFDNLIVDPSRNGISKAVLNLIVNKIKPKRIIYMSCNPATQAANFNILKEYYKIEEIKILDMFPQTYHIESIMVLNLIENK